MRIDTCFYSRNHMKKFILFSVLSLLSFSLESKEEIGIVVDPHYSPYTGSELLLSSRQILQSAEDFLLLREDPANLSFGGKIKSIWGRACEVYGLWLPVNSFISTVQHEFFGHGYRIRSSKMAEVRGYSFGSPLPYGDGSGATEFAASEQIPISTLQMITIAGCEAENILARELKMRWISDKRIDGRQASLYSINALSPLLYSLVDPEDLEEEGVDSMFSGHDIDDYLTLLYLQYPGAKMEQATLSKDMLWNLADPVLLYSFAATWMYIFSGKKIGLPMIPLKGSIALLPNAKVQMAPYGLEYYLETFLTYKSRPIYTYLKKGSYNALKYYGVGVYYDKCYDNGNTSAGFNIDAWYQPYLLSTWSYENLLEGQRSQEDFEEAQEMKYGVAASFVSRFRLGKMPAFFYSNIGYKTAGYVPGLQVESGFIGRIGLISEF